MLDSEKGWRVHYTSLLSFYAWVPHTPAFGSIHRQEQLENKFLEALFQIRRKIINLYSVGLLAESVVRSLYKHETCLIISNKVNNPNSG